MSLADAIEKGDVPRKGKRLGCSVGVWLDTLDTRDKDAALAVLADTENWSRARASDLFRAHGLKVGQNQVAQHRRGECTCDAR